MGKLFFRGEGVIIYICIHCLQTIKKPLSLHSRAFPFSLRRLGHLIWYRGPESNRHGVTSTGF